MISGHWARRRHGGSHLVGVGLVATIVCCLFALLGASSALADQATYTDSQTIPVPPASSFAASAGGDGWAVALSPIQVFNIFHHDGSLQIACHYQSSAAACWSPVTITDSGYGFASNGQPGMYLDQSSGKLYVFATRSDGTGGVVCINPSSTGATSCGFTALTPTGQAPLASGISNLSTQMQVGAKLYSFNYVNGTPSGAEDEMLCFDTSTDAACAGQPYPVSIGSGSVSDGTFPEPSTATIGGLVFVPIDVGSSNTTIACFDPSTNSSCAGSWPVSTGTSYASSYGSPYPLLDATGALTGICLPTGTDPCYGLDGSNKATPSAMTSVIAASSPWNGPAVVLGPRIYVPDGNANGSAGDIECYDYSTSASCSGYPHAFSNLFYLYTVNTDPQRPTCLWVNADSGADQIQDFDAYTGGACGEGPVRALASQFVVNAPACTPGNYVSLQVTSPSPSAYTSGTVTFENNDGNPIAGISPVSLDSSGMADLSGLDLNTATGLPQFLITLNGTSGTPSSVSIQLIWTGTNDPSCVGPTTTVVAGPENTSPPTISGTAQDGQVLTADPGAWSMTSTYAYKWYDCTAATAGSLGSGCSVIPGATSSTYTVQPTDVGSSLEAAVTATGGGDTSSPVDTTVTGPVVPGPAAIVTVAMSPTAVYANGTSQSTATATVTDDWGYPIKGDTVSFTSSGSNTIGTVTDNGDGTYSAPVTSTATPGTVSIKATDTTSPLMPSGGTTLNQAVVAGPASNIVLSLSPASVHADGYSTSVATATVTDAVGNPVLGDNVSITSSTGAGQVGPVTAGPAPGQYQATITATTQAVKATITATDNSVNPSISTSATLTQTVDKAAYVTVSLLPATISANGSSTTVATAMVTDQYGNPVSGDTVNFASSGAQPIGATTNNGDGTYSATITSSKVAGTWTITATDGSLSGSTTLTQTAGPVVLGGLFWGEDGANAIGRANIDGSDSNRNFLTPTNDSYSVAVDGSHLYWANYGTGSVGRSSLDGTGATQNFVVTGATHIEGVAVDGSHVYWSDPAAGTIGRANLDGTGATDSFITGVSAYALAVDAAHIYWSDPGGNSIGRANLDGSGATNGFIAGADQPFGVAVDSSHVYWSNSGTPGTSTGTIGRANLDGSGADQSFVTGASFPEGVAVSRNHVYWANVSGAGPIGRANLDGTGVDQSFIGNTGAFGLAIQSSSTGLSLSHSSITADGSSTTTATFTATDSYGNPVSGDSVSITTDGGQPVGPVVDNGNGTYSATITSTTSVGTATVTATDNTTGVSTSTTLTQTSGKPAYVSVSLSSPSITADGSSTSLATATLTDEYGNPVSGDTNLTIGTASVTGAPTVGATSAGANPGTYDATVTASTAAGSYTITAGDITVTPHASGSTTLTETAGPASNLALSLSPSSIIANGSSTSTATATVTDQYGNPVAEPVSDISITSDGGQSISPVAAGGTAGTYVATVTSTTTAGSSHITATDTDAGATGTPTDMQTLTQTHDKAANVTVSLSPSSITADGVQTTQATATVTDLYGNPISDDLTNLQFTTDGGQPIATPAAGTNPGQYVATITSTKTAGTSTITVTDTNSPSQPSGTATLTQTAGAPVGGGNGDIYWSNIGTNSIGEATPDGSSVNQNFITGASAPAGVATDGQYVYWTNADSGTIGRAKLDGSDVNQDFITIPGAGFVIGLAVDAQHIYWTDESNGTIGEANLDGTNPSDNFVTGATGPYQVAVSSQHIYWTNLNGGTIGEADLDGSNVNEGFVTGINSPGGIAVDDQYVYWGSADFSTNEIGRANLDGSNPNYDFISGAEDVNGLAVNGQHIYWTDYAGNESVGEANLDGTGANDQFITGASYPVGVAAPGQQLLKLSPPTIVADGTSETVAMFKLADANGNPVSNQNVSITSDDGQTIGQVTPGPLPGTYVATITSTTTAGTSTITASDNSVIPAITSTATLTQTPGRAAYVSVQLGSPQLTADGASTTTATATVTDVFGNAVPNQSVAITTNGAQSVSPATDHGDGTYTSTITASTVAGPSTITATDGSVTPNVSGATTLTQVAGPATTAALSLSPASIVADGRSQSVATATITDQFGNPVSGDDVTLASDGSQTVSPASAGTTPGTYVATITSTTSVGTANITATDTSPSAVGSPTQTQTLTQTRDKAAYVTVSLSKPSITANGVSTSVATARITDLNGNPATGDPVTITSDGGQAIGSVTDNGDGTYSATITSTKTAGVSTITAADTSSGAQPSGTATLTQVPGPATDVALSLSPASVVADGSSTSVATANVTDANGNPVSGDTVTIKSSGLQAVSAVKAGASPGTYVATITSTTSAGTATIKASDTSVLPSVSGTAVLTQKPGSGDDVSVVLSPASITADGASATVATATITDPQGNPVSGDSVSFSSSGGQSIGSVTVGGSPGTYVTKITATTTSGSSTITATDTSVAPHPSGQAVLTQVAGAPADVSVSLSPATLDADGHSTTVALVGVTDVHGNPISGDHPALTSSGGQSVGSIAAGPSPGTYVAPITSTATPGVSTVTAQDGGVSASTELNQTDVSVPAIVIGTPVAGGIYLQSEKIRAQYGCYDAVPNDVASCAGPAANGARIDTTTLGAHAFIVTAITKTGHVTRLKVHYFVVPATPTSSPLVYLAGAVRMSKGHVTVPIACLAHSGGCVGTSELRLTVVRHGKNGSLSYGYVKVGFVRYRLSAGQRANLRVTLTPLGLRVFGSGFSMPTVLVSVDQHGHQRVLVFN